LAGWNSLRSYGEYGISGVIGGGSAEGGAVERHMLPMIENAEGRRLLADRRTSSIS
jgi:hypothetical protein